MKKVSLILSAVLMTIMSLTQVKAQESMSKLASTLFDYTEEEIDPKIEDLRSDLITLSRASNKYEAKRNVKGEAQDLYYNAKKGKELVKELYGEILKDSSSLFGESTLEELEKIEKYYSTMALSAKSLSNYCNREMSSSLYSIMQDKYNDMVEVQNKLQKNKDVYLNISGILSTLELSRNRTKIAEENEAISTSKSQSSDLVDKYYCRDLKNDARSSLRLLVQNAQISEKTADIRYYLINQMCESAINRGLTEKEFETMFEPVSQKDCERIPDDLKEIMKYYDEPSIKQVTEKIMKSCSDAVANKDSRLDFMAQNQKYLDKIGVIELEVPSIEWWK